MGDRYFNGPSVDFGGKMGELTFGWHKDPYDSKDYLHKRKFVTLPPVVSHADLLTPVRRQLCSDCVGHGVGLALNGVKVELGIFEEWCSPTYIYNGARYIEGTLPFDLGCYPKDALDWTLKNGILLEHFWPYAGFSKAVPSSERMKQADRYGGFQYWRCVDGIDGICDALASGFLVAIGSPWFKEWENTDACGRLAVPTSSSMEIGGHEYCLYGHNRNEGFFEAQQSWGIEWGNKGRFIMPFESIDIFKQRGGYDAHHVIFTKDIDTTPNPTPGCNPFTRLFRPA